MYRGKIYTISCEALGVPPTKEASYQAANAWWATKRDGLDGVESHPTIRQELARRRDWAGRNDPELAGALDDRLQRLNHASEDEAVTLALTPDLDDRIESLRELGVIIPDTISRLVLDGIMGDQRVFRARHERTAKIPQDRTISAQVARYLENMRVITRSESGHSVAEYDLISRFVGEFEKWLLQEGRTSIDDIDANLWEKWYYHVLAGEGAIETKKKRYRYARTLVEWLAGKDLIAEPKNLRNRKFRFQGGQRAVPTLTTAEVRALIEAAPGQLKLHLLLMLNCGYTQTDLANLRPDQVDWVEGRIRRKRSKTEDHDGVPEVDYPLWPLTFELLKLHGNRQGELVLLTKSGLAWVRDVLDDGGKRRKVDAIKSNYVHLAKRGFALKPLKVLRKTSTTLIEGHNPAYTSHFLGHSPRSIKDRSYVATNGATFDGVIAWLGEQYGFGA
jgi:integrase